jgi:AcrR family transcriptional regulator
MKPSKSRAARPKPYHHGELRPAALKAAERILERNGVHALTLRAVARAVGVSHTAPKNHFDDLTGLLSELAAVGYQRFGAGLSTAMETAGKDPRDRMKAMGAAYVGFAQAHPGLFQLMFRSERLDLKRPSLREAIDGSREALRTAAAARTPGKPLSQREAAAQAVAMWSLVHGFAMLLLDGRLQNTIASLPGEDAHSLLDLVLTTTRVGD